MESSPGLAKPARAKRPREPFWPSCETRCHSERSRGTLFIDVRRDVSTALDMTTDKIRNFIDGQFVEPSGGEYLDNIEPATGKPYSMVPDSNERDVEFAVVAAEKAFPNWSKTPAVDRSRILLRIADLIERDLEKL